MTMHTATVDLPAQTTLDQAIVALLRLRRGEVPGDATLTQAAILRFEYLQRAAAGKGEGDTPSDPDPEGIVLSPNDGDADADADADGGDAGELTPDNPADEA